MSEDAVERARALLRNDPGACTADTVAELLKEIEALRNALAVLRAAPEAAGGTAHE